MRIELEADPVPIVKIIGARVSRALTQATIQRTVAGLEGCFSLQSTTDAQCLTIHLSPEKIYLCRGIDKNARLLIHLDFNTNQPPRIERLWRHPWFAFRVSKLLQPRLLNWSVAARNFWQMTQHVAGMPSRLILVCSDTAEVLILERDLIQQMPLAALEEDFSTDDAAMTVHGSALTLSQLFSGEKVLLESAIKGEIKILSNLKHAAVLTGLTLQQLLGELKAPEAASTPEGQIP